MADHDAELRLLVADDHPQYRRGLVRVCRLIGGFGVVAEVSDVAEALAACARVAPNLALVDDELPGGGGLALARRIKAVLPGCAVLLLSVCEEAERIEKERDPAIVRCLSRLIEPADLVAALRAVLASSGRRTALAGIDEPPGDALADLAARVHIDPRAPQPEDSMRRPASRRRGIMGIRTMQTG